MEQVSARQREANGRLDLSVGLWRLHRADIQELVTVPSFPQALSSLQRAEQSLRPFQNWRIQSFSEPVVARCKKLTRFSWFAIVEPEARRRPSHPPNQQVHALATQAMEGNCRSCIVRRCSLDKLVICTERTVGRSKRSVATSPTTNGRLLTATASACSGDPKNAAREILIIAANCQRRRGALMKRTSWLKLLGLCLATATGLCLPAAAQQTKPNIVVIMGDDIGMWNIGAYHRGLMAGRTPNLDKIAKEGMLFTDYYAEASCTAGRANFITGELPIRTGMTTVGQAGASVGLPAEAVTLATVLKSMGYATGQFGKNHLGDKNEFLPTVHGFDEFFGYLYHLDAMEDPAHPNYPQNLLATVGPRNMLHSWATDIDDPTEQPRWGKVGKQKIEDAGTLYPERMKTVDDEILDKALKFVDKARADGKPFFLWLNPTRMHVVTHLSEKYEKMR